MQYLMSKPNMKHDKDGIYSYSIPNSKKICIAAGSCRAWCMIDKGNFRVYPNIKQGYQDRYELTLQSNFADLISKELQNRKIKGNKITYVRPHVSGEYYNQAYLDKWATIFRNNPGVKFVTYTKAFKRLDFTEVYKLDNVAVIESFGGIDPVNINNPHAIVFDSLDDIPADYTNCYESDALAWEIAKNGNGNIALIMK